jgi:UDP-N-acetylglucosamine--N-acetylmuramyl-(pentapeptide) pyrophosphoryl-undecaprenol N-acetylglucosamine transferase
VSDKKTLAVACGGTGGHFYPGLAIAKKFEELGGKAVLFIGGHNIEEHLRLAESNGLEAVAVPAVRIPRSPLKLPLFPFQMLSCVLKNARALKKAKADVALGMGSWASVPMGFASFRLKIPLALHEANAVPGQANRALSRKAKLLGLTLPLKEELRTAARQVSVGLPLRDEFIQASTTPLSDELRGGYCQQLGLDPEGKILFVFGGSQGAAAINSAVSQAAGAIAKAPGNWQLIQLTGTDDNQELESAYKRAGLKAVVKKRDDAIIRLYQLADAMICRAGASSILEAAALGKYPMFVPLPTAKGDHQTANADCVSRLDGGLNVPQADLSQDTILAYLKDVTERDPSTPSEIIQLSRTDAAEAMAKEIMGLA